MSLRALFDHRVEVWRLAERRGFAAENVQTLEPVHRPETGWNCAFVPPPVGTFTMQDIGPGEAPRGRVQLLMSPVLDVVERDVLRFVAGPQSPSRWRVAAPVVKPRGHHLEVVAEPWVGTFPDEEA